MKNLLLIAVSLIALSVNAQSFTVKLMYQSPLCHGASTGSINLLVDGGTAPYTYLWSDGSTSATLANIPAGTYGVTVTDNLGIVSSTSLLIAEPAQLGATGFVVNASSVGGNDGAIALTPRGGTYDYAYLWSNGATTKDIANLTAGDYTVTITDGFGCQSTLTKTVGEFGGLNVGGMHNSNGAGNPNNNNGLVAPNGTGAPKLSMSLYPNPTSNFLKVASKAGAQIEVMNSNGQVVLNHTATSDIETLSVSELANGNYIVRVKAGAEVLSQSINVAK